MNDNEKLAYAREARDGASECADRIMSLMRGYNLPVAMMALAAVVNGIPTHLEPHYIEMLDILKTRKASR